MRIAFLASLLLALFSYTVVQAHDSVATSAGSSIDSSIKNSKIRLEIRTETGTRYNFWVTRDTNVSPKAKPTEIEIVSEIKGTAIIVIDTYPSIPGGMSYCQAGKERFLRVISISKKLPEETFRVKLESCRDNIELASPGIEWLSESSTLRIHWLLGPTAKGMPEVRTIRIAPNGRPG